MIPANPEHRDASIMQVGERREHPEAYPRHRVPPGEPEIEQVTHDDDRPGMSRNVPQQTQERPLCIERGDAKVYVANHMARGR
jgi:hypothetical protein